MTLNAHELELTPLFCSDPFAIADENRLYSLESRLYSLESRLYSLAPGAPIPVGAEIDPLRVEASGKTAKDNFIKES